MWLSMKPRSKAFLTRGFRSLMPSIAMALCQPNPDIAPCLWPHLHERVSEEPACHCPIEFSSQRHHGECLADARPDEFFGVPVQNDVVDRLRVAIEYRRHDAVARGEDPIPKDPANPS